MKNLNIFLNIQNKTDVKIRRNILVDSAEELLSEKKLTGNFEIDLSVLGEKEIQLLNKKYLKHNRSTDVLSFPINKKNSIKFFSSKNSENPILLGQIVISSSVAKEQAAKKNIKFHDEFSYLFLHGLKHLLGYHHR